MERIGVLIGKKGEIKKELEKRTGIKLIIDSNLGEISFDESKNEDPLAYIKIENVINAVGRGFSPLNALLLLNVNYEFFVFDLHDYVGKKKTHLHRVKSRVIGREGKTKRIIEDLTNSKLSIYGHTIAIISDFFKIDIVKKAIDMILSGNKHATVYRFIETKIKEIRRMEKLGL
jgi:ribosomal RNA assembly protein